MLQTQLFQVEKKDRYDIDLSFLELPEDEPLSQKIIEANSKLAYEVIAITLEDLLSKDKDIRRSAEEFCFSNEFEHRQIRLLWLGWLNMEEDILAKAARKRLERLSLSAMDS